MFKNHLKVAFRNLQKQKFYAFINILGLTIGIAATLLIIVYIADELSFDRFHKKVNNIYRVTTKAILSGQTSQIATSCAPFAPTVVEEFPEVDEALRLDRRTNVTVSFGEKSFTEKNLLLADSNFFKVFSFELLQGNPETALKAPNKVVLTESMATKYFGYTGRGDSSPIGKSLKIGDGTSEVSGIAADPPGNSHFDFDMIVSMNTLGNINNFEWTSNNFYTYLVLNPKANPKEVESKFDKLIEKYVGPEIEKYLGFGLQKFKEEGGDYGYSLQPLTDIHLKSKLDDEIGVNGDINYLYIFGVIAFFIVTIACINFMNLSTARSANRAKEVGIRKAAGAARTGLVNQFLTESMLFSFISTVLALGLIFLVLPSFNNLAGKEISFHLLLKGSVLGGLAGIIIIIGLLAGSYPALYLTSFKPAEVLKGKIRAGFKSSGIRSVLVVFQFTISIGLIVSTLVVYRQLNMMQTSNLGFNKENVFVIDNTFWLGENKEAFKNELRNYNGIINVSGSSSLPPNIESNTVHRAVGENQQEHILYWYRADYNHLATLNLELKAGRFFSEDFPSDSSAVILNETAMKTIGWDSHESQKLITFNRSHDGDVLNVIGVVKDFNFESLKSSIRPLAIVLGGGNLISARLAPGNLQESIDLIESKWKQYAPDVPFEYSFLDENLESLYRGEQRLSKIFALFTGLAIVIACLGLLGLATFTAEQRSKEIGIRKTLGATAGHVVVLMSKEFTKLVVVSFVLAIPLSYLFLSKWLEGFAYKVDIGVASFLVGGLISLLIAWLTVSYQSFKAAVANPVNSLRSE